jgi:hypothetical protein
MPKSDGDHGSVDFGVQEPHRAGVAQCVRRQVLVFQARTVALGDRGVTAGDVRLGHPPPAAAPGLIHQTWSASCADRLGRNPNEHGKKTTSKIGSMTVLTAH